MSLPFPLLSTGERESPRCDLIIEKFFQFIEIPSLVGALSQQHVTDVIGMEDSDGIDARELTVDDIAVRCKFVEKPERLPDILMRISQHREPIGTRREFFIVTLRRCTHATTTRVFMNEQY
jgi:hypothetical protein